MTTPNDILDAFAALVAERLAERTVSTEYVTEAEVLVVFGSLDRARRAIRKGEIAGAICGRRVVVRRVALAQFVDAHAPKAPSPNREATAEEIAAANGCGGSAPRKVG